MLGLAAVNTGNNLLFLLVAAQLGFLIVSGLLGHANLRGLRVRVEPPAEVYADIPARVRVHLDNPRRWLPALLVSVQMGDSLALFPLVPPCGSATRSLTLSWPRRGRRRTPAPLLASAFPVGFFRRFLASAETREVLVFPRPRACLAPAGDELRTSGVRQGRQRGQEGDLLALADYSGSEPLRLIHWKQSARQQGLKVKELSAAQQPPLWVEPERCPGDTLEARLSCAAHLIIAASRAGRAVGLHLAGTALVPAVGERQRLRLLRELACHDNP